MLTIDSPLSLSKYPGVACDVPSHFYSFSKELNPYWTKAFSGSEEIQAYWVGVSCLFTFLGLRLALRTSTDSGDDADPQKVQLTVQDLVGFSLRRRSLE